VKQKVNSGRFWHRFAIVIHFAVYSTLFCSILHVYCSHEMMFYSLGSQYSMYSVA